MAEKKHRSQGLFDRNSKRSSPAGTATFVGLRALDPFVQYSILAHGVGGKIVVALGSHVIYSSAATSTGYALLDNLDLSPYRLILLSMAVGSSLKHIVWKLAIGAEYMPAKGAAIVGLFNTVFNSLNSLFFISTWTSPAYGGGEGPGTPGWPQAQLVVGSGMFITGIVLELASEFQRKAFKNTEKSKGKPCTSGLWSFSRHINYFAYTLWRGGFALAAGGWTWAAVVSSFFVYNFINDSIPELDAYCENRYADMWHDYKAKTPYALVPYIY